MKKKISILIMVISLLVLTGCQDKKQDIKSNEENSAEEVKELKDVTLDEKEIEEFEEVIDYLPDNKEKFSKSMEAKDLNNQELLDMGIRFPDDNNKEDIENKINDFFGPNIKVKMEDYVCPICNVVQLNYDSSTGTLVFSEDHPGHGGPWGWIEKEILGAQTDGEKYYIKVGKMYFDLSNTTDSFDFSGYKTSKESLNAENAIVENIHETKYCTDSNNRCDYKQMMMDNIDKINTYTYVFNKEKDNLYFEGYIMNKKDNES